jgi:molybdate transport repressor ModE-like protein
MTPPRIEFRQLASFVLACQNATIAETARQLGVSPSTLSVALHSLERDLDMQLLHRQGVYLRPLPAAFWLFPQAIALLHAESAARRAVRQSGGIAERIHVRLDLSFTIGRFSKAVSRTVEAMTLCSPEVAVDFDFLDADRPAAAPPVPAMSTEIVIGYGPDDAGEGTGLPLLADDWVMVSLGESGPASGIHDEQKLVLVRMRQTLIDAITAYAGRQGIADRLSQLDAGPADLADLLQAVPGALFLMPRSMMADRLGLGKIHVEPLDPALVSPVTARCSGPVTPAARLFLERLGAALVGEEANAAFEPELSVRQMRYFSLIEQCGGISAAARVANVSQPTLSLQVQRMEQVLGAPLLERGRTGVALSEAGRRLLPMALDIERRIDRILATRRDIAAHTQSSLAIGMLPSSGHDSAMTGRVAEALAEMATQHPQCRLRLVEGTNSALHNGVRSGELNLAIVASVQGLLPHLQLGPSERLSIIAHPALGLSGRAEIGLSEACRLPLLLGPRHLSIHRAFLDAANAARLAVNQVMEIGSLPLAIAMARRSPFCTILPSSSVRQDLAEGRLTASAIREDLGLGTVSIIFSGERSLSESERALVKALSAAFGRSETAGLAGAGDVPA